VMVHSANGHRTRKGGNSGAPPDLYTTALALHSTPIGPRPGSRPQDRHGVSASRGRPWSRYIVAMDVGTWRSGRTGSAPRRETFG
jgi:hypothetical protein